MLAVEACLLEKLSALFCPADVLDIDEETVAKLAAEDGGSSTERAQYNKKLNVLEDRLLELKSVQEYLPVLFKGMTITKQSTQKHAH